MIPIDTKQSCATRSEESFVNEEGPAQPRRADPSTRMENGRTTAAYHRRFLVIDSAASRVQVINLILLVFYVPAP